MFEAIGPGLKAVWQAIGWVRCEARERLIDFLQKQIPQALPRQRTEAIRPADQPELSHGGRASTPKTTAEHR